MKGKKLLGILLAMMMCVAMVSFAGCFGSEPDSSSESSSSSSSNREPWVDDNVDPEGWT